MWYVHPMSQSTSPMKQYTFLFTIQSVFLTICLFLAGFLSLYGYYKGREASLIAGEKLLEELNKSVQIQWKGTLERPYQLAKHLPEIPNITTKPDGVNHPARNLLVTSLSNSDEIHGIFTSWTDGDVYHVAKVTQTPHLSEFAPFPSNAKFYAEFIFFEEGTKMSKVAFLDKRGKQIGKTHMRHSAFDIDTRPWYAMGKGKTEMYRVPAYMSVATSTLGTTYANPFTESGGGIFGVDVQLESLVKFLEAQTPGPDGHIVVFEPSGAIPVHGDMMDKNSVPTATDIMEKGMEEKSMMDMENPVFSEVYKQYVMGNYTLDKAFTLEAGGECQIAVFSELSAKESDKIIAIFAPEAYFTAEAIRIRNNCLIISFGIIVVSIIAVVFFSKRVSNPLKVLADEADQIRKFKLESDVKVKSRIKEVSELASSVRSMKDGISNFTQYVPRDLVKRYMDTGTAPEVGGDRRTLTLLFTDVEGFTPLSETMQPQTIIAMLSEYFSIMGQMITRCDGTVDKYIGDALMAFWNAPEQTEDHTRSGCEASLKCARAVMDYAFLCPISKTLTPLKTRFALHRGDTVVGNIGSADRLNYTAMGSVVNMASRLEGLNKYYGTTILASQEVKEHGEKYFIFRSVDRVIPKGVHQPMTIYELVGSAPDNGSPDIEVPEKRMEFLRQWETVYAMYHARDWENALAILETMDAEDSLVALYLDRVRELLVNDPGPNWGGVVIMNQK